MFLNNHSASPAVRSPMHCQQGPPPAVNTDASLAHPSLPVAGHAATLLERGQSLPGHRGASGEAATPRSGARCEDAGERSSSASPPEAGGVPATVGAAEAQAPCSSNDNVKVLVWSCPHAMTCVQFRPLFHQRHGLDAKFGYRWLQCASRGIYSALCRTRMRRMDMRMHSQLYMHMCFTVRSPAEISPLPQL